MKLGGLPEQLLGMLERTDFRDLASAATMRVAAELRVAFAVTSPGAVLLSPSCGHDAGEAAVALRHALELSLLLRLWPDNPVLAGLAAARTAALFAALERPAPLSGRTATPDFAALTADVPLDAARIEALWPRLARHQPNAPVMVPTGTQAALAAVWRLLGPTEWLMQGGGDARLSVDPLTGLNGYGCSHRPRPWAVTFASSTASSSSERGYSGAEAMRQRLLRPANGGDAVEAALADVRRELAALYRLPPGCVVALAPSGTDGELFALAAAQLHPAHRPLTVVLVAPDETGSGVPLAAVGRHFAQDTAHGVAVARGEPIDGFRADTLLEVVALRGVDGSVRPASAVAADCDRIADAAVAGGRRLVLHRVDVTKTGLLAPEIDVLRAIQVRHPGCVDVVVDGCQGRFSAARVREYVEHGWIVLLTGSKFLTGPPFSGAVVFPAAMHARLTGKRLPVGLRDYSARPEWPKLLPAAAGLAADGNVGLALRWAAALAELLAFDAVADGFKEHAIDCFIARVGAAIAANPDLRLVEVPPLRRAGRTATWDQARTILSFALRDPETGGWLAVAAARQVYSWLNADLGRALPGGLAVADRGLSHRRFHAGQPARLILAGNEAGVLRISAGARLVSGEPAHASLPPQQRLDREIADAVAMLAKVSLILRHWPALQRAMPTATYI